MDVGVALPQYDFTGPGRALPWGTVASAARQAEELGFGSVWLSDHLFIDLARYGGTPGEHPGLDPVVGLSAVAAATRRVRLGTLALCAPLRPATVLAKQLATLDVLCGGRLTVTLGAGWNEAEFAAAGVPFEAPGARLRHLAESVEVLRGMFGGGPFSYQGRHERADGARCLPVPVQRPHPPIWVGGKGERLVEVAARVADGWSTVWVWTPDGYRRRLAVLDSACDQLGRDPSSVTRSLGLHTLVGEDGPDLVRRFDRLRASTPAGVMGGVSLAEWRTGRLVGTVAEVAEQVAVWEGLGVDSLVVNAGTLPFTTSAPDDVEMIAAACRLGAPCRTSDPPS